MYLTYSRTGPISDHPLVLLHALPLDKSMFDDLDLGRDVIAFSAPGFDGSSSGEAVQEAFGYENPSLDAYAEAVLADLDELGVEIFDIGGLSMGGPVAAAIIEKAPNRVQAVILMDTNLGQDAPEAAEKRLEAAEAADGGDISSVAPMKDTMTAEKTKTDRPEVYEDLAARLEAVPPAGLAWIQRGMAARPDRRQVIANIDRLLLVRGDEDASCSAEMMEQLAQINPQARLVTIADAGHFTALETPEELSAIISDFLA